MEKTYLFGDCYSLLQVNPKTFRDWLEKAKIDPKHQVSKKDGRLKYLTEEQLKQLAEDHERPWPPQPRDKVPVAITISQYKRLEERTDEHAAALAEQDQRLDDQAHELAECLGRLKSLEQAHARAMEQVTRLTLLANDQANQITALQQARPRSRSTSTGPVDQATELEPGLVSANAFAQLHNINTGTAKSAYQTGRIPVVRGTWRHDGTAIQVALDGEGRAQFHQLYAGHRDFTACPDCPHTS